MTTKDTTHLKLKPAEYEEKWRHKWLKERVYQPDMASANPSTSSGRTPFYNLMMFPYPSAEGLHVGNMYAFTGVDIYGRFQRMRGHDVFEPIGLDGFGIHSENYAIKVGRHPKEQAKVSQENFYRQLQSIGNGFAWENRLETFDPDYYKWTQWIFTQMFNHGLAYRKKSPVNFCPSCKTVLSDEQVIDGHCERCKSLVEKREMEQWFFRISKYAERLLQNTYKESFQWPEKVKIGQRNWIGKKEGINITYEIEGIDESVTVFTTAPVNFGMTFLVLGVEHDLVTKMINGDLPVSQNIKDSIIKYVRQTKKKTEMERITQGKEKTGVFTGLYAINSINKKKVPIYISDFVLKNVGTGAVQGCPGHDVKDFQFAKKFGLPIIRVIVGEDGDVSPISREEQVIEKGMKGNFVNSEFLNGLTFEDGLQKTMDYFEKHGVGKRVVIYKLRDWCISRQRYWGAPIPMINCPACGWVSVPQDQLPVLLPDLDDWKPEGTGKGPLAKLKDWMKVKCPKCQGDAERETDVCDTFLDSSWYHLRYPSIGLESATEKPWDEQVTKKWLPVTQYIGGAEHTVLHLLYARFVSMALHDWKYVDFDEPYTKFFAHGLIIKDGAKMSKSRGNVVVPDEYIRLYGADTLRTYLMFLGAFSDGGDFRDSGIAGMYKFLSRVYRLCVNHSQGQIANDTLDRLNKIMHKTIKGVTADIGAFHYNTSIAKIMEYVNFLTDNEGSSTKEAIKTLLLLLAPFAPHMTEELYQKLYRSVSDNFKSIHLEPWPTFDDKYLVEDVVTVVVQVNGKLRDSLSISAQKAKDQKEVGTVATSSEKVKKYLDGLKIKKVIFVPGKLINFVI